MLEDQNNTVAPNEELDRKKKRNKRLLIALIALDVLVVGYLIFQLYIAIGK